MIIDPDEMIQAFLQVAQLARVPLHPLDLRHKLLPARHRPPTELPPGFQAVYAFLLCDRCLKVGKAGPKTQARFTSQHYGMNAPSTLAKSILAHRQRLADVLEPEQRSEVERLDNETAGAWIKQNTTRLHFFLPISTGPLALSLLEAFVQCRLSPSFEGKAISLGPPG